ncbi:hypothetical protein B0H14DRAFT_2619678 [Mycena olivaceomarginata]|nr:hypothetical protein B0H14DRAFT_2619678 [Mycena olivaceomarginata]
MGRQNANPDPYPPDSSPQTRGAARYIDLLWARFSSLASNCLVSPPTPVSPAQLKTFQYPDSLVDYEAQLTREAAPVVEVQNTPQARRATRITHHRCIRPAIINALRVAGAAPGAAGGGGAQADLVDVALGHERVRRYEGDKEEEGRDEVAGVHALGAAFICLQAGPALYSTETRVPGRQIACQIPGYMHPLSLEAIGLNDEGPSVIHCAVSKPRSIPDRGRKPTQASSRTPAGRKPNFKSALYPAGRRFTQRLELVQHRD